ncbi:hypothetical protein M23134_04762 [Microscilla marina ATCC 23134]|uniref:Uncharacterized protein n=1 Tax=Microscilla marina ATCC 23134 TaxID=313606 RepID=A1ZRI4_MICM2|nr:hypothetical protein M23134_04762 [Microscilla marina ATCC 23134]
MLSFYFIFLNKKTTSSKATLPETGRLCPVTILVLWTLHK